MSLRCLGLTTRSVFAVWMLICCLFDFMAVVVLIVVSGESSQMMF